MIYYKFTIIFQYYTIVYTKKSQSISSKQMIQQPSIDNPTQNPVKKQKKYHPFNIPPNMDICMKHRICSQFGNSIQQLSQQSCPCCNSPPSQLLSIKCKISEIYQVSQPVGYYFSYIKLVVVALVVVMLINGVYTLYQIISQCHKDQSQEENQCLYVYGIPLPKIHIFFKTILIILNIVVIVFLYIFSAYLFFRHTYLHQRNIISHQKPSDYSILISGYNHQKIKIQDLQAQLQGYQIQDIIYTHKIKKYSQWLGEKSRLDAELIRYRQQGHVQKIAKIDKKIRQLQDSMLHTKNKLTLGQDQQFRTDKVIVTFRQSIHKKKFEQLYGLTMYKNIYHTFCGGSPLMLNETPVFIQPLGQPSQIIWQNLQITSRSRYLRVLISNLVAVILLFCSFVMIVYLSKGQQDQTQLGDTLMSLIFAILIQVVNQILSFLIDQFTRWEGRYTMTGEISLKLYKNCAGFFLNTTLLPFMLFVLDLFNPEEDDIVRNILSIFFISNLISPYIGLFLQPQTIIKLIKRKIILSKGNNSLVTQIKANQIFQKNDFMLDQRYALVQQLIMNCMFYAAIFPVGILITIVGLFITYWSSKIWIIKYCSLPKFSYKLGLHINLISCFFPTIYAFGYAANIYMTRKQVEFNRTYSLILAAATCPITLLFILFGQRVALYFIQNHRKSVLKSMANKRKYFKTYKSLNPTSFIHQNLGASVEGTNKQGTMWDKLVSYVAAKQSGIILNDDLQEDRSSRRSSRLSINQDQQEDQARQP